jgi:hypothetical protein
MVEDVEDAEHRAVPCHDKLNGASTASAYGHAWTAGNQGLIDLFTLALTHSLIALALWRLLFRADLDSDDGEVREPRRAWGKDRADAPDEGPSGA